jgi:hypothetical protein
VVCSGSSVAVFDDQSWQPLRVQRQTTSSSSSTLLKRVCLCRCVWLVHTDDRTAAVAAAVAASAGEEDADVGPAL